MKKIFLSIATLFALITGANAQNTFPSSGSVGIGTTSPNASSLLEVKSTTKGLLIPRMTSAQRSLIGGPATGLLVYQTDGTTGFYYYFGSGWKLLLTSAANTSLSNLSSTIAINHSLTPGTTSTISLGSSTKKWKNGYFSGDVSVGGALTAGSSSVSIGVSGTGSSYGVYGVSSGGYGVYGNSGYLGVYGVGGTYGTYGYSSSGYGAYGVSGTGNGVYGTGANGVYGSGSNYGVYGAGGPYGVYGNGSSYGVWGNSSYLGTYGVGDSYGISGSSSAGQAASGYSSTGYGVVGTSTDGYGGYFSSGSSYGGYFFSSSSYGLRAATSTGAYAGVFDGSVFTSGSYNSSDRNLKKNIQEFTDAMSIINKLKPKYYEFKDDAKYAFLNLPKGNHYGLIAQDLELVLPNLVKESVHQKANMPEAPMKPSTDGKPLSPAAFAEQKAKATAASAATMESVTIKAINYTELIPILIKGMQELNAKNEDLQSQIIELKSLIAKGGNNTSIISGNGYLKQNVPNPAGNSTVISYYLPDNAGYAQIKITDIKGSVIKTFNAKGEGQINLRSGELPAGTYNYSLYLNNKTVDTKQMVITK